MRPFKYALLLALAAAVMALAPPRGHAAPSFDCQAPTIAEKEICRLPPDAVYVERVSATEFPANREINRQNRKNGPCATTRASPNAASMGFLSIFPEKINRE
jgi:hypothetical protein